MEFHFCHKQSINVWRTQCRFISVFFSVNKFYFRNFSRHLFKRLFLLENRCLEDVFLGAPSQDRARQTNCLTFARKKLVLEVLLAAFLKKRMHGDTGYDWKTTPSSKGNTYICFFFSVVLTVRWSFCVSDLVREVSFFQRLRGKEEWNGPWEH